MSKRTAITFFALLLVPLAALEARAAERTTVGAIRWDAWFADTVNPYETNLADKQWHGRLRSARWWMSGRK